MVVRLVADGLGHVEPCMASSSLELLAEVLFALPFWVHLAELEEALACLVVYAWECILCELVRSLYLCV